MSTEESTLTTTTTPPATRPGRRVVNLSATLQTGGARAVLARCAPGIVPTRVLNTEDGITEAESKGITVYQLGDVDDQGHALVLNEHDFKLLPLYDGLGNIIGHRLSTGTDTILGIMSQSAYDEYRRTEGGTLPRWNAELHGGKDGETLALETLRPARSNLPSNVRKVQLNTAPS
jgi:hypothetical protein